MNNKEQLIDQLKARIRERKQTTFTTNQPRQVISEGMFGNGESREQYEKRIMNTPEAWTGTRLT